jgi:hypothetical protein
VIVNVSHGEVVTPLAVLEALFHDLGQRGIRYCHWKSNSHLAAAVRGETDLDLLVDREQVDAFRSTLSDHDFKAMVAAPGKDYPGVENYLGFDESSGHLVHLHVHYQLVLGQQHVKDHRIPIEEEMLDSVREIAGVPVPSAAMELIVLAMRAVLKYRTRDAAKDVLGIRTSGIPRSILSEAEWLYADTSEEEIAETLGGLPPACHPGSLLTSSTSSHRRVGTVAVCSYSENACEESCVPFVGWHDRAQQPGTSLPSGGRGHARSGSARDAG